MFDGRRSRLTLPHILLLVMVVMWSALPMGEAEAATKPVSMVNYAFSPKSLSIPIGTTVKWTNTTSSIHTATATNGAFNSHNVTAGQSFRFTFTHAGTFHYYCMYHHALGMTGTIIVH